MSCTLKVGAYLTRGKNESALPTLKTSYTGKQTSLDQFYFQERIPLTVRDLSRVVHL